ncbi:MAG TPA: hypothetical protein VMT95_06170 [Candidatus Binatia bacterium]|nr:hypothetical protein [Candidatus Binatia bacterium]
MNKRRTFVAEVALTIVAFAAQVAPLSAHLTSMPAPISQPASPVQLKSCYLGTDFMFNDPKLVSEQTKMQLSADLAKVAPSQYRMLGLRFEFGLDSGKRSSDVIVFTGSEASHDRDVMDTAPPGLNPSGYLPRVADYDDYHCGVDFATSLDWKRAWFDASSDVVACKSAMIVPESASVWLTALELRPTRSDGVFVMLDEKQKRLFWSLDGAEPQYAKADQFGRAVVPMGQLSQAAHTLAFGPVATRLDQQVCFRPFLATR